MTENFPKGTYQAGKVVPIHVNVAAGTYYKGQILAHVTNSTDYVAHKSSASNGTEIARVLFYEGNTESVTYSARTRVLVLGPGSEYMAEGLRNSSGAALPVTDALKQQLLEEASIIIR